MAFLQEYNQSEHFVLLNGDGTIEDMTEPLFKIYFSHAL
jgi:hypothetical protein